VSRFDQKRCPWLPSTVPAGPRHRQDQLEFFERGRAGHRQPPPRGKTLGGTSSINGMLYVRGNPADYDNWAQMGCRGWSYEEVLPFSGASSRSVISFPSCETVRNYVFISKCLVFICS
jgi:choline dehydrogenase-like flavoprotein